MNDDAATAAQIRLLLASARKLAAEKRWHGITEGIDAMFSTMDEDDG